MTPVLAVAPAGVTFASLTAGGFHNCASTASGSASCWGRNDSGQLGNGALPVNSTTPVPVTPPDGVTFATLSAGWFHSCGLTSGGVAYCWGYNLQGQLGNGEMGDNSAVPVLVVE
jgi:alpha-tubulin suppressor-like RCC1 family protein